MKQSLLNALRKGTNVAIKIDSHPIVLVPHLRVSQGHGRWTLVEQPPRPEQMFTVESNASTLTGIAGSGGGVTSTEGATVHSWSYELVGPYNCQMEINDTWIEDGTIYRITAIQPFNEYERRGVIAAIGKDPSYGN